MTLRSFPQFKKFYSANANTLADVVIAILPTADGSYDLFSSSYECSELEPLKPLVDI